MKPQNLPVFQMKIVLDLLTNNLISLNTFLKKCEKLTQSDFNRLNGESHHKRE